MPAADQWPKRCGCCGATYSPVEWLRLPLRGRCAGLELRDCPCRSTLAIETTEGPTDE